MPSHCSRLPFAGSWKPPAKILPAALTARARTPSASWIPEPIGDHALPFQRATPEAATGPAESNWPPRMRSPLGAVAIAQTVAAEVFECTPPPMLDQVEPFHCARLFAAVLPIVANEPPTARSPLACTTSERTGPSGLPPSDDHCSVARSTITRLFAADA